MQLRSIPLSTAYLSIVVAAVPAVIGAVVVPGAFFALVLGLAAAFWAMALRQSRCAECKECARDDFLTSLAQQINLADEAYRCKCSRKAVVEEKCSGPLWRCTRTLKACVDDPVQAFAGAIAAEEAQKAAAAFTAATFLSASAIVEALGVLLTAGALATTLLAFSLLALAMAIYGLKMLPLRQALAEHEAAGIILELAPWLRRRQSSAEGSSLAE